MNRSPNLDVACKQGYGREFQLSPLAQAEFRNNQWDSVLGPLVVKRRKILSTTLARHLASSNS